MNQDATNLFQKIYTHESDTIFRFCLVRVSNREQALDITQETFLRLWQNLVQKREIFNVRAFLFTVAHRLVIDWYRKKKSVSLDSVLGDGKANENDLIDLTVGSPEVGAEARYLLDKIKDLAPGHKQPVYFRFVEGLSPVEIGKILGITANAASVRVNRGLSELRKKTGYALPGTALAM